MDSASSPKSPKLTTAASSFVLAAAITVWFNTALACAKDAYAPLKDLMKVPTGQDWTLHGILDLLLFAGLGFVFMNTRVAEKIDPSRLIGILIASVATAGLGLALWYALF